MTDIANQQINVQKVENISNRTAGKLGVNGNKSKKRQYFFHLRFCTGMQKSV
jgi:hypothetical protein